MCPPVPCSSFTITAPGPYPSGDPRNDFYPGNPADPSSAPGYGPNTRTLLQFRVVDRVGEVDDPISLPSTLTPTDPFILTQTPGVPTPIPTSIKGQSVGFRRLTLNEDFDGFGRLIQFLGTDVATSCAAPVVRPGVYFVPGYGSRLTAGPMKSGRSSISRGMFTRSISTS